MEPSDDDCKATDEQASCEKDKISSNMQQNQENISLSNDIFIASGPYFAQFNRSVCFSHYFSVLLLIIVLLFTV